MKWFIILGSVCSVWDSNRIWRFSKVLHGKSSKRENQRELILLFRLVSFFSLQIYESRCLYLVTAHKSASCEPRRVTQRTLGRRDAPVLKEFTEPAESGKTGRNNPNRTGEKEECRVGEYWWKGMRMFWMERVVERSEMCSVNFILFLLLCERKHDDEQVGWISYTAAGDRTVPVHMNSALLPRPRRGFWTTNWPQCQNCAFLFCP